MTGTHITSQFLLIKQEERNFSDGPLKTPCSQHRGSDLSLVGELRSTATRYGQKKKRTDLTLYTKIRWIIALNEKKIKTIKEKLFK